MRFGICLAVLLATTAPALAQEAPLEEIVVTGQKRSSDDDEGGGVPAIGLRRTADFAVQRVWISGDTREAAKRQEEIYAMLKGAIEQARKIGGIELATGELVVEPLTLANYRDVVLAGGNRTDSNQLSFLVKTRLTGKIDAKEALARITTFVKKVPPVGRAEIVSSGDLTLSVVGPDQYRSQILDLVAADIKATVDKLGPDYAVEANGLDKRVEWTRASLTEVMLYIPYSYTVLPKGR